MSLEKVADFLKQNDNYEILTHAYPDGDTLGSGYALCLALQQLGKNARVITTNLPKDFEFLLNGVKQQSFDARTVVSVDIASEQLLGCNRERYSGRIDLCVDHHAINRIEAPLKHVEADAAANCEILYRLFRLMNIDITKQIADCLYTGVSTDTGCFRYTNTTADTLRIAADLLELGADNVFINKVMFETKTKKKIALEREIYDTIEYCCADRCAIISVTREMKNKLGVGDDELEGLASIPRQIEGVMVGITMRERDEGGFKVSVRSDSHVNAAEFCARFGGGGHAAAAGCTVKGSLEEAKARLIAEIGDFI
ncbi:MAG: DHH family phosphoesterase [Ruminococcus sp.]|nr:DHH family phosphoesterase [Ruminococcus sp.]